MNQKELVRWMLIPILHHPGLVLGNSVRGYQKAEQGVATTYQSVKCNCRSQSSDD
jgi:hypothetical protein